MDDDYALDDTVMADADAGPFAVPLLREHPLGRPARVGDRRHDAPRAAMPRTGLVDDLRLGREGSGGVAAQVPERGGGHQHADPADPFPVADGRTRDVADGERFRYTFVR